VNVIGAGVLAITINPETNGWHIEYMPDVLWFDGPTDMIPGDLRFDIQGIGTHELGHALGLAHTSVLAATMFPGASPGPASVTLRSLDLDDRQGIQSITAYGVATGSKPKILALQGILSAQQPMTIIGQNFGTAPNSNEVWFRDDAADNTPRKVLALNSTLGGTAISVVIPCDVVNGDVFVKVGSATTGNTLSNGMPLTLQTGGNGAPCLQCVGPITPSPVAILNANPTEIFVAAPAGTPPMTCLPTQPLCPASPQYSSVTQVNVGPFTLDPSQFIIDNDSQIRFTLPLFPSLGSFNVTLTNLGGTSCAGTLTVIAVPTPVLLTGPPVQSSGSTFTATLASPLGTNHVLVFSGSNLPSVLPGIVGLGLGNGFTDVSFLPTPVPNAAGVSQLQFPIPPTPGGATVFFQMAAVSISNPFAVLPIPVSNVTSVTVL
ncbi:MAG TPA: matrixin family metalloprotease, partial [Planctomycetota bacterium]|nr:matrixin family metalloprotease [Planctomycetota bacterium]